jgi:hypothetical protein
MLVSPAAAGQETYYDLPLRRLPLTEGALPSGRWSDVRPAEAAPPRVTLVGPGEAYLHFQLAGRSRRRARPIPWVFWRGAAYLFENTRLAVRAPAGQDVAGHLQVPRLDGEGMLRLPFLLPAEAGSQEARDGFCVAKEQHYLRLLHSGAPGAAWFRHQARTAHRERLGQAADGQAGPGARLPRRETPLEETYAIFTGGRALSENLQLDRLLRPGEDTELTVDVETLPGISVQEMDWSALVRDLNPEKDSLADLVPADQHALFFPTFRDMTDLMDEARAHGTPVLRLLEVRAEDALTHERYERQLCLSTDALARLLAPRLVGSVAFTGSDPYLRTGTDVAVLFEAGDEAALRRLIAVRVAAAIEADAAVQPVQGKVGGVAYVGARSPDRSVCSYVATVGPAVVVTNSLHQLRRVVATWQGEADSMASLDEYTFFRSRYPPGDGEETGFLMVSDAAIRRWCGPRWRIGASRRTRAAALLAEVEARRADASTPDEALEVAVPLPGGGAVRLTESGAISDTYGTLAFLTPIAELPIRMAGEAEAGSYRRWRRRYQRAWRRYYDPIAVRFVVRPERLGADMTVMPLIAGTDYGPIMELARGVELREDAADPHPEALGHFAVALNADSAPVLDVWGLLTLFAPEPGPRPPEWVGESLAVYVDESPFWQDARAHADDPDSFFEGEFHRMPIALRVAISDERRLGELVVWARSSIETNRPGMTVWETHAHCGLPYVTVSPSEDEKQRVPRFKDLRVHYAPLPDVLIISLDEEVMKRALARQAARDEGAEPAAGVEPWLGRSMALQLDGPFVEIAQLLAGDDYRALMRRRSWGNIPVLNEWKRRYPERDPVRVHEAMWERRLVCPGGGNYVWDEEWQTMASTACGHPGIPKDGPTWPDAVRAVEFANLGVTFERAGLRAVARLDRRAPQGSAAE